MSNPYSKYLETQIMTASPGRLLIISYDAAIRFARLAAESMNKHDLNEQNTNIRKVQDILLELSASLNPKVNAKLTDDLNAIYTWMFDQLTHANINDDQKALQNIIRLLSELRSTWIEADKMAHNDASLSEAA